MSERPREYYQMTDRTFEDYLGYMHIPENFLKGKRIADIGAGLAEFTEQANARLKELGTHVYALDINYDIIGSKDWEDQMTVRGVDLVHETEENMFLIEQRAILERKRAAILAAAKESTEHPKHIAADMRALPLADESMDIVLYNNSVFPYQNKNKSGNDTIVNTFSEGLRVLKEDGQIRIKTTPFRQLDKFDPEFGTTAAGEHLKLYIWEEYGNGDDSNPELLEWFKFLEQTGMHFYIIQYTENDLNTNKPEWRQGSFVITKHAHTFTDAEIQIQLDTETRVRVLELDCRGSSNANITPAKVAYEYTKS